MFCQILNRKIVVVSAPGKRHSDDIKVTDLLISLGEKTLKGTNADDEFNTIINRYSSIADELGLSHTIIDEIKENLLSIMKQE